MIEVVYGQVAHAGNGLHKRFCSKWHGIRHLGLRFAWEHLHSGHCHSFGGVSFFFSFVMHGWLGRNGLDFSIHIIYFQSPIAVVYYHIMLAVNQR